MTRATRAYTALLLAALATGCSKPVHRAEIKEQAQPAGAVTSWAHVTSYAGFTNDGIRAYVDIESVSHSGNWSGIQMTPVPPGHKNYSATIETDNTMFPKKTYFGFTMGNDEVNLYSMSLPCGGSQRIVLLYNNGWKRAAFDAKECNMPSQLEIETSQQETTRLIREAMKGK